MPGTNLTRDEAAERGRLLTVDSYDVELDLTTSETTFGSTTVIRFGCSEPGASTFADLVDATVHSITLNGTELDPSQVYRDSRIQLDDLATDNELRVVADCTYSRTGEGLHRFVDPADDRVYLYTQFEVPDARRVYCTFEQPDLKSVFQFTVTAPASWTVVSNAPTPEPTPRGEGVATWSFGTTERMSTYITALVAGEYHATYDTYEGRHGTIRLGHLCRQSMVPFLDLEELVRITRQGFAFFEEAFDYPYPFARAESEGDGASLRKYDQAYVPEYNMGAMENAACVTFRDEYLPRSRQTRAFFEGRANTVLHEMAHMWFGDLVTMKWWDDLWLNESFAEWASHHAMAQATEYADAWTGFTNARKNWAYRQDQLPSTHPIAADNHDLEAVEVNFDGITYAKGASTLKQLVAWVGEEEFLRGLAAYFKSHAFANSEFADLLAALEESSGRDLDAWAQEWLQTSGVNTLTAELEVDDEGRFREIAVRQTAHPDFPTLRRHRIGIGLYDRVGSRLVLRSRLETDIRGERTAVPELVGEARPDLLLLNDGDLTYAKIRLDSRSLRSLLDGIDTLEDSLARALCWGAAWDMTRDAELSASAFAELVLRGVAVESDLTAVGALLRNAKSAVDSYTAPEHRERVRRQWEQGVLEHALAADPGSDHQLAFVRAVAEAARGDEALDHVQGWYDGSQVLPGLTLDADLRWALLTSLAAAGRADEAAIESELAGDKTISGQEHAAAARTVLPDPDAKERAWLAAVERDDVPNETQRQVALAFQTPGQEELLQPYVARYLEAAETLWERKGVQRASTVLRFMFPRALPTQDTLEAVDRWLQSSRANPAAVRYVREGAADLERALAAQACDASAG